MHKAIWIGLGGFIGAILRYCVSGFVQNLSNSISFPYGTLAVNVIGCFLIGFISIISETVGMGTEMRLMVIIGFLGSFTTYSTFAKETVNLLESKNLLMFVFNLNAHIFLGLFAVVLGQVIASSLWR